MVFECTSIWTSIIKRSWKVKRMVMVTLKLQRYLTEQTLKSKKSLPYDLYFDHFFGFSYPFYDACSYGSTFKRVLFNEDSIWIWSGACKMAVNICSVLSIGLLLPGLTVFVFSITLLRKIAVKCPGLFFRVLITWYCHECE